MPRFAATLTVVLTTGGAPRFRSRPLILISASSPQDPASRRFADKLGSFGHSAQRSGYFAFREKYSEIFMNAAICSTCGSGRVHSSRRRKTWERAVATFGGRMRRCHQCNCRFVQLGGTLVHTTEFQRAGRQLVTLVAILAAAALVLAASMWISRPSASGPAETAWAAHLSTPC